MTEGCVKMHSNKGEFLVCLVLTMMLLCCGEKGKLRFVRLHCCRAAWNKTRLNVLPAEDSLSNIK